jgi:TRAP-type C4-dicarboxylate transport system permease small subunit
MADQEGRHYHGGMEKSSGGLLSAFESLEQIVMCVAFVVLFGALSWGVVSRYVVPTPATWVEEVTSISFAWLVFVGAAEVHRRKQHVSVDLLTNLLPPVIQRSLALAVETFVVTYCFYIAYLGLQQTIATHSSTTSMLRIPVSVSYAGFTLGVLLMALRGLLRIVRTNSSSKKEH